jgi:hypothetical protein
MTTIKSSQARSIFLFGEPPGFFQSFRHIECAESRINAPLLAFEANLSSALQVANIPFQLTQVAVVEQRITQLTIAEKIRCRTKVEAGEIAEEDTDKVAGEIARDRLSGELKDDEMITRFANHTLLILDRHLQNDEFAESAQELLRQVLVICWGALEILVNDILRVLLNAKPQLMRTLTIHKPYRDVLSGQIMLAALEANQFNLSSAMGDLFAEAVKLDSLEKIRDAIRLCVTDPAVDAMLKDERLWRISQQRHLIVHRRGLVDARYIERTSDHAVIGDHLKLDAAYVEASLVLVRDTGCSIYGATQKRLLEAPTIVHG